GQGTPSQRDAAEARSLRLIAQRLTNPADGKPHPRSPSPSNGEGAGGEDKHASPPHPPFPPLHRMERGPGGEDKRASPPHPPLRPLHRMERGPGGEADWISQARVIRTSGMSRFGGARLFEWFNDFVIGRDWRREERLLELWVQYRIYEIVSHGRAIRELKF